MVNTMSLYISGISICYEHCVNPELYEKCHFYSLYSEFINLINFSAELWTRKAKIINCITDRKLIRQKRGFGTVWYTGLTSVYGIFTLKCGFLYFCEQAINRYQTSCTDLFHLSFIQSICCLLRCYNFRYIGKFFQDILYLLLERFI